MIYRGKVRGGVVVFEPGVQLPEGLDVTIAVSAEAPPADLSKFGATLKNGVPVFPPCASRASAGLELVNELRDEAL